MEISYLLVSDMASLASPSNTRPRQSGPALLSVPMPSHWIYVARGFSLQVHDIVSS
ncbi:hypothetical protein GBAR_LOCUS15082 [Geodia barretti]|uniref:Uncharacterized protein n=1 Tax=Geodia barretti TaxID=519541 RepID=A0AA35S9Z3_GEOBA|nr:hypothetical protein GBAR_LOCUS15082 [Geodia barretti]